MYPSQLKLYTSVLNVNTKDSATHQTGRWQSLLKRVLCEDSSGAAEAQSVGHYCWELVLGVLVVGGGAKTPSEYCKLTHSKIQKGEGVSKALRPSYSKQNKSQL